MSWFILVVSDVSNMDTSEDGEKKSRAGAAGAAQMPRRMLMAHIFDQHCAADLVYYMEDTDWVLNNLSDEKKTPFSKIYRQVFDHLTGVNPRRHTDRGDAQVKEMWRKAQLSYMLAKGGPVMQQHLPMDTSNSSSSNSSLDCKITLHDGFLAAMVGPLKYAGYSISLRSTDLSQLTVMPLVPSGRSKKVKAIEDADKGQRYKPWAIQQLTKGVKVKKIALRAIFKCWF